MRRKTIESFLRLCILMVAILRQILIVWNREKHIIYVRLQKTLQGFNMAPSEGLPLKKITKFLSMEHQQVQKIGTLPIGLVPFKGQMIIGSFMQIWVGGSTFQTKPGLASGFGQMNLVGPRPIVPNELEHYQGEKRIAFLSMKPGMTGLWQVSGRSDLDYPERVDFELSYKSKRSFLLDLKILFKTFLVVIKRKGAH